MNRLRFYWLGQKLVWEDRIFRWKKPIVPSLVIDGTTDDAAVARHAFKVVSAALRAARGFPENKARLLPPHWRAIYTCFYLDAEVRNGGLHQFFWNSEDTFNDWLLEDLEFVGSSAIRDIVRQALKLHRGYDYPEEKHHAGLSWDAFAEGYTEERFEVCDKAYFSCAERLLELVGATIRRNASLYSQNA